MYRVLEQRHIVKMMMALLLATNACQGGGENAVTPPPPTPFITLSIASSTITVTQGASGTVATTATRSNGFAGAVNLSLEGAPTGVTGTFTPDAIPASGTGSSLILIVSSSATAGTYNLTIRGKATGCSDYTVALTLSVVPAGEFTVSVTPSTVSVQQGAANSTVVDIDRTGGFTGDVTLAVTGAPSGLSVIPAQTVMSGSRTPIIVTATTVAIGTYPLTLHATAVGLAERTANFVVQVMAAQNFVTMQFCGPDVPVWAAAQSEGGVWTRLAASHGTYNFPIGLRGAVAVVVPRYGGFETEVIYGTASELIEFGQSTAALCANPLSGSKQLTGTVAGLSSSEFADIAMGAASDGVEGPGTKQFWLYYAPDGLTDLTAVRLRDTDSGYVPNKLIIRRGINPPNGSALALLDFSGGEAFAPSIGTGQIVGLSGDIADVSGALVTANHTTALLWDAVSTFPTYEADGLPPAQLVDGDLYQVSVWSQPVGVTNRARGAVSYLRTLANQVITLGPTISMPTVRAISSSAPQRFEVMVGRQGAYGNNLFAWFTQSGGATDRDILLYITADYLGGAPSSWDVTIPDLSAAGYDASLGLAAGAGVSWVVMATNARSLLSVLDQSLTESSGYSFGAARSEDAAMALKHPRVAKGVLPWRRF